MTALTGLGLPYQLGTDRPCDAPEVWQDFAVGLDGLLVATNTILGRVSPTVPAAKITRSVGIEIPVFSVGVPIPFDGVEIDTDDMVDFSTSQFDILPRRAGTYFVTAEIKLYILASANIEIILTRGPLTVGSFGFGFTSVAEQQSSIAGNSPTNPFTIRVSSHSPWTSTDTVGFGLVAIPDAPGTLGVLYATLAAYWVSDVEVRS